MGDHRINLQVRFEMHGHEAHIDSWRNYGPGYVDEISEWFLEQVSIAMDRYMEGQFQWVTEKEAAERAEYERLKRKFESEPNG